MMTDLSTSFAIKYSNLIIKSTVRLVSFEYFMLVNQPPRCKEDRHGIGGGSDNSIDMFKCQVSRSFNHYRNHVTIEYRLIQSLTIVHI